MPTSNLASETSNSERLLRASGSAAEQAHSLTDTTLQGSDTRNGGMYDSGFVWPSRSHRFVGGTTSNALTRPAASDTTAESSHSRLASGRHAGEFFRRGLFASCGVFLVGLGAIGVVLPGVPTVGPLLMASFFFAKSFPVLEQRLIRNRFFGPYLQFLDRPAEMPLRAKIVALVMMWTSIGISCWILQHRPLAPIWLPPLLIALGLIGTLVIAGLGRWSRTVFKTSVSSK